MPEKFEILLCTLNARYIHASFGLRYLKANLGPLRDNCKICEFTIKDRPLDVAEKLMRHDPKIIGFGVYIWNTAETLAVVEIVRALRPEIKIVIGGPEVSYEWVKQPIFALTDHLITGEGETSFRELCEHLLNNDSSIVPEKRIAGKAPDVKEMVMPYSLYSEEDIANRVIYVEASRGCPFRCQFCLSSLDKKVRNFPLIPFLEEMEKLLDRGVRQFKFVDRTFNLAPKISTKILEFFLEKSRPGLFLHFEMVPDRFPESLRGLIGQFPAGSVQFEVGIQTFNEDVAARIDRRQNMKKIDENLGYLSQKTGVHLHTDLIIGLPGEDINSFGKGFDHLISLGVQEIQVGILKRLRGAPISRHTKEWNMIYSPSPPYEILRNKDWSFSELARMRRFARYWDIVANSGRFNETRSILLSGESAFNNFLLFTDWLHEKSGATHGISNSRMQSFLLKHLTEVRGHNPEEVAECLYKDHIRVTGKDHVPQLLRGYVSRKRTNIQVSRDLPARQRRHVEH